MIYITGDTHGLKDIKKFKSSYFNNVINKKGNYLIITGDFGITWNKEVLKKCLALYGSMKCTILFVDGNNENFDILDKMPIKKFAGGNVHKLGKNIYHLMRGEIFNIEGKSFLAFGGADSWDAPFRYPKTNRVEGVSFWKREQPSMEEFENAIKNLHKNGNEVDFVLTHEATSEVANSFGSSSYTTSKMLDKIFDISKFKFWFCGHHHKNYAFDCAIKCMFDEFDCIENYVNLPTKSHGSNKKIIKNDEFCFKV